MVDTVSTDRRVALVTGASYGIGAASALALARAGLDIVVSELDTDALADSVAAIEAAGARAHGVALDVRALDSIEAAVASSLDAFGHIDVLVNNAGVLLRKSALDVTFEEFDQVLSVNLRGAYFMSQRVARHMVDTGQPGRIVNLASTFSAIGAPLVSVYGITKAAISGMTRMLAVEWAEHDIRVNAVAPGSVATKLRAALMAENPELTEMMVAKIPLGRLGEPKDMAGAVAYLASPAADYVNGHTLYVDGGLTIS